MGVGSASGRKRDGALLTVGWFVRDDGGYTTVAVALALLVSLSLVFATAAGQWGLTRSADVQEVADATALAGANCVAAFSTIVQTVDACALSLGLTGLVLCAAGLVVAAIPVVQAHAPTVLGTGRSVLESRRDFSRSAALGLRALERALPSLIMANSASCVSANCRQGVEYFGCAVPFPQSSESDYSFLDNEIDVGEVDEAARELREATQEKEDALVRAADAKARAWRADCVDDPLCMRSRAHTLAGLSDAANPNYASPDDWRFAYACQRACNYYLVRSQQEAPEGSSAEELSRSAARESFYEYAHGTIGDAVCIEEDPVSLRLPELPHTRAQVRETTLYTDVRWPCTIEEGARTLHSTLACPGAEGEESGYASLAQLEAGEVTRCETCGMDVATMGSVADASTNIDNGFEHYWRIVVEASRDYQEAKDAAALAEQRMQDAAGKGAEAFQTAIDALATEHATIVPAGAWGCVSLVVRKEGTVVPTELTAAFLSGATLPPGAALSAATLAPDQSADGGTILSHVLDGVRERGSLAVDIVGNVTELWGRLLVGYGSAYGNVSSAASDLLDNMGSVFGERTATWLRQRVQAIVSALAIEPVDLRMRKPVLVYSQKVLDRDGRTALAEARRIVESLPSSCAEIVGINWSVILRELGADKFCVATLPVPGSPDTSVPLIIDVAALVGAS